MEKITGTILLILFLFYTGGWKYASAQQSYNAKKGISSPNADTWVAADALGRQLPDHNQTGGKRADKITSGGFSGASIPYSPDPLVSYQWPDPKAADGLELYTLRPINAHTEVSGSLANVESLNAEVKGKGDIMLDFGQINAAWLEFDSSDLAGSVEMSISENNENAIKVKGIAEQNNLSLPEIALRYLFSMEEADRVVIGPRTMDKIKESLRIWKEGPLDKKYLTR